MLQPTNLTPMRRDQLPEGVLCADGFDGAIIGSAQRGGEEIAVYDRERCIEILRAQFTEACESGTCADADSECDHWLEAEEYFSYNTERASEYLGAKGPVYVSRLCAACGCDAEGCACLAEAA
jgi:hypothetical protein